MTKALITVTPMTTATLNRQACWLAWAVLCDGTLEACGNGAQFQYPIFPTVREARQWKRDHSEFVGKIIKVCIERSDINRA